MSLLESMGDLFAFVDKVGRDPEFESDRRYHQPEAVRIVDANTCPDCDGETCIDGVGDCPACDGGGTLPELRHACLIAWKVLDLVGNEPAETEKDADRLARSLAHLILGKDTYRRTGAVLDRHHRLHNGDEA